MSKYVSWATVLLLLVLCFGTGAYLLLYKLAERRRQQLFSRRKLISEDEWLARHFSGRKQEELIVIREIIRRIGGLIAIQPTALLPTDRLSTEISLPSWYLLDDTLDGIEQLLGEYFGDEFAIKPEWETLNDVLLGSIERSQGGNGR